MWNNASWWDRQPNHSQPPAFPQYSGRAIRSGYTPAPPDYSYIFERNELEREYLRGAQNLICSNIERTGKCGFAECPFVHGLLCFVCNLNVLHPTDIPRGTLHIKECLKRGPPKTCLMCLNVVGPCNDPGRSIYGILSRCNHPFCFMCINNWRKSKGSVNTKNCPVCNVISERCRPSSNWVEDPEEKSQLFATVKAKECHFYLRRFGKCPFHQTCAHRHTSEADVDADTDADTVAPPPE